MEGGVEARTVGMAMGDFDLMNEDLLQNILSRLPALSFASAACVSRSWTSLCDRVLSRPKLASALSLNPSLHGAVKEVLDKVLSEPIRPHFALASVGWPESKLGSVHRLITERLGSTTPVVTCVASGIIGRDALTDQFKEVQWEMPDDDEGLDDRGIVLTVGFLPGVKVDVIPLLRPKEECQEPLVDKFVMDIDDFAASMLDRIAPDAIIMFGAQSVDMKPILNTLDGALPTETAIVGDPSSNFLYQCGNHSRHDCGSMEYFSDAAALVFARDRNKSHGIGETQFYFSLSTGLLPVGPLYRAASVRVHGSNLSTWVTAKRQGSNVILDGQRILDDMNDELGNRIDCPTLYIGVMERRKCKIGSNKVRLLTSLAFHEVICGDEQYLYVDGVGIKTGDVFQIYHSDSNAAITSCGNAFLNLRNYAEDVAVYNNGDENKKEVIGALVFSCCGRGEPFFGLSNLDSSPITRNFPDAPVAGQFCAGEIGRCSSSCILGENSEQSSARCCLHVYSTVYLAMFYVPSISGP